MFNVRTKKEESDKGSDERSQRKHLEYERGCVRQVCSLLLDHIQMPQLTCTISILSKTRRHIFYRPPKICKSHPGAAESVDTTQGKGSKEMLDKMARSNKSLKMTTEMYFLR